MPRSRAQSTQRRALVDARPGSRRPRACGPEPPTTGLVSVERMSTGMPAARSRPTPRPSARLTRTSSSPDSATSAVLSVCTPSKSVTTASTSIAAAVGRRGERMARGDRELLFGVDLDRGRLPHHDDADRAEEAVTRASEALRIHHVEGAGLEELGLAVLTARPHRRVVVDAHAAARGVRARGTRTTRRRRTRCRTRGGPRARWRRRGRSDR